jgi:hypothetical protein
MGAPDEWLNNREYSKLVGQRPFRVDYASNGNLDFTFWNFGVGLHFYAVFE